MKKWALVLCYFALAGCTRSGGGRDTCKPEYDPLYTNFDGRYRGAATQHLVDSNGKDETRHYDGLNFSISQFGPSMGFTSIVVLPRKDSYDFCSDTFDRVSSFGAGFYSALKIRGEGNRMMAQFHVSGKAIDASGTLFYEAESDWSFLIGEKLPDIIPTDSIIPEFAEEGQIDISRIIRNEENLEAAFEEKMKVEQ